MARDEQGEFISAHVFSCGHIQPTNRRRPPTSKRKTAPCYQCGSGTRKQHDDHQHRAQWRHTLQGMLAEADTEAHAAEVLRCGLMLSVLKEGDMRAVVLMEQLRVACEAAGLVRVVDVASRVQP